MFLPENGIDLCLAKVRYKFRIKEFELDNNQKEHIAIKNKMGFIIIPMSTITFRVLISLSIKWNICMCMYTHTLPLLVVLKVKIYV